MNMRLLLNATMNSLRDYYNKEPPIFKLLNKINKSPNYARNVNPKLTLYPLKISRSHLRSP